MGPESLSSLLLYVKIEGIDFFPKLFPYPYFYYETAFLEFFFPSTIQSFFIWDSTDDLSQVFVRASFGDPPLRREK